MPSFDVVNYSLRPNKSIQRCLVFDGVRLLAECLDLNRLLYLGFGSIWFTDFQIAHKQLQIRDMISIEADEIGFERAKFNRPFKTVRIENGLSGDVIPPLFGDPNLSGRPWLVWLDYDGPMDESVVEDIRLLIEGAPPNSILLATFNSVGSRYGKPKDRPERLRVLLGSVIPDDLSRERCEDASFPSTLAHYTLQHMEAAAATIARPGGFIPGFKLTYRDGANMVTVGGVLPQKGAVPAAKSAIHSADWPGIAEHPITTPPLTLKESVVLQAQLPRSRPLTRKTIQRLGFDLDEEQIRAFERYYRYYPAYAQILM